MGRIVIIFAFLKFFMMVICKVLKFLCPCSQNSKKQTLARFFLLLTLHHASSVTFKRATLWIVVPHLTMSILLANLAQVTMSEIHFFAFSNKHAPSCFGKKVGPRHSVCSIPDSLSRPFLFLLLTSFSRHEKHSVWNWTGPKKHLLQLYYCCGLKSHHPSTWHMPRVLGG